MLSLHQSMVTIVQSFPYASLREHCKFLIMPIVILIRLLTEGQSVKAISRSEEVRSGMDKIHFDFVLKLK